MPTKARKPKPGPKPETPEQIARLAEVERLKAIAWTAFQAHPSYAKVSQNGLVRGGPVDVDGCKVFIIFIPSIPPKVVARVWLDSTEMARVELSDSGSLA